MKTRFQISRKRSQSHPDGNRPCRSHVLALGRNRFQNPGHRARHAWRSPPVVFEPGDGFVGIASDFVPIERGLVIVRMHGWVEPLRWQAVDLGQQFPGKGDGFALEIVAYREIAQHLKEGERALVAHTINVGGAKTFLRGGQPHGWRSFTPQKIGNHLLHARGSQQHCRVVARDER